MSKSQITRRRFMQGTAGVAAAAAFGQASSLFAADPIRFWAATIARAGDKNFNAIAAFANIKISHAVKSASAEEAIQKMIIGDGQKLYDALTDNGGGMEDALSSQNVLAPLDVSKIPNWKNVLPTYLEGGVGAHTIRSNGQIYAVPYISNADSLAYNYDKLGFHPNSWEVLFDSQFKGQVAMQNDFGPTLTNTAIYLKSSGKQDIVDATNMTASEIKGVAQFLIDMKKKGQFRLFWTGFQGGVDILASGEVIMSSCWEPIAIVAARKGQNIIYGDMKEGHQVWNNIIMLTKGGKQRGQEDNFYKLANAFLSEWYGAKTLKAFGFMPQMKMEGVIKYMESAPGYDEKTRKNLSDLVRRKALRLKNPGNAWQNVYPKELRAYTDWWSRVQAA